jgi:hypothetical protein
MRLISESIMTRAALAWMAFAIGAIPGFVAGNSLGREQAWHRCRSSDSSVGVIRSGAVLPRNVPALRVPVQEGDSQDNGQN